MYDDILVKTGELARRLTSAGMNRHGGRNREALADLAAAAELAKAVAADAELAGAAVPRTWNEWEVWHA